MTTNVLVIGATGNQGRAVTKALLERGLAVRALTRDPSSDRARALGDAVDLVTGDLADPASIEAAAAGVDAAFLVTTPFAPGVGTDGEIQLGRSAIDALARASVPHVVYSSVSDADRETGVPHFDSKADGERHLAATDLAWTVTAPVFFADNVLFPWHLKEIAAGTFRQALPADRRLQVVSVRDIGRFNAAVIARGPGELAGRRINYAGDELTPAAMTATLAEATGRTLEFVQQPIAELEAMRDMAEMYRWFDRVGYTADIARLREEFPEVEWQTFAEWASSRDWSALLQ